MKTIGISARSRILWGVLIISGVLTGCGGGSSSDSQSAEGNAPPTAAGAPPTGMMAALFGGGTARIPGSWTTSASDPSAAASGGTVASASPTPGTSSADTSDSAASSSAASSSAATDTLASAQKPQIEGSAPGTATVGQSYSFQPQASGGAGSLTFLVVNKPAWASFNPSSGLLTGTPAKGDVGSDPSIEISVTDGNSVVSLAPFSIVVANAPAQQSAPGTVTLSWQAPTENDDGTPLTNLAGFNIHYGTQPQDYTSVIKVANPGLGTYVIDGLPAGRYYFSVAAYNASGVESSFSSEVSASVN